MRALGWAGRLWIGVLLVTVLLVGLLLALRLLLPLPFLSSSPALVRATPADGAAGVLPRARLILRFSTPMNPRSVEHALRIDPPILATLVWSDDTTTLTISPTHGLRPDAAYRVALGDGTLSRMFRASERPIVLSFHTAPAPAVLAVLPPDGAQDIALDTPVGIRFSRSIVLTTALALPATLPELRFDPPLDGVATWLDSTTVLFRPTASLRPGVRYRATLAAGLTDIGGGELGKDFAWSFSTPPPRALAVAPPAGERWVAPRAPLALRLSQPLDRAAIQANLTITPTIAGELSTVTLPDLTQAITFTPSVDWLPGTTYTALLRGGGASSDIARWSFTTAPRPAVIGRFPGEGQTLPPGQDVRLIFNTPVDGDALAQAIRLTPPAGPIRVTAADVEARIAADLRAATVYTMTLPESLTDRNGVPFGREYQIRFVTASAGSALELPDAPAHIFQVPPGRAVSLPIRRTNLSALNLDLYSLDEASTVRALAFRERDWSDFQPDRYAQPLLRSWVVPLADTLNATVDERLPLSLAGGEPMPPGVYYLRIRTPEGPRADLLVLVSRVRLALQSSDSGLLIWAIDVISATPIGDLPVVLYEDGAPIERGTTDASGLWRVDRFSASAAPLYIGLAAGERPGIVSSAWSEGAITAAAGYRVWLTTDRAVYRPGERVALAGFVRRTASQSNVLPPPGLAVLISARPLGTPDLFYRQTVPISSTGVISAGFVIPADARPGEYILGAAIDNRVFQTTFAVAAEDAAPLAVAVSAPPQVYARDSAPVTITVATPEGIPLAGVAISWTLNVERLPFPAYQDYIFGDDERAQERSDTRSGLGQTDAEGHFSVVISDTLAGDTPLRYRLVARATEPGGSSTAAEGAFLVVPARVYAGVRLPSRILLAGQRGAVEALAMTPEGQPVARAAVSVTVDRRTWEQTDAPDTNGEKRPILRPHDEPVLKLSGLTDADGAILLPLTLRQGGEYRVLVDVADAEGQRMTSATTIWVGAPGFTGWRAEPAGRARLITSRAAYRPGETATLLLATPLTDATALVTVARDAGIVPDARAIRAGAPFTLTLTPEGAPSARVAVLLASRPSSSSAITTVTPLVLATTTVPVLADRAISVTVAADRAAYAPGATATLTITTTDMRGAGVPADIVLDLVGASAAPRYNPAETFYSAAAPVLATARMPGARPAPVPVPDALPLPPVAHAPAPLPAPAVYWNPVLRTGAAGVLTLTVQLPQEPVDLRALAWAASGADRFGMGQTTLSVTQPLTLRAETPLFLRAGDEVELAALVHNISTIPQQASVSLSADGVEVRGAALLHSIAIAPGAVVRVVWPALVSDASHAALNFSLESAGGPPQRTRMGRLIRPASAPTPIAGGVGLLREYVDPLSDRSLDLTGLRAGQLLRVRLTVVNTEVRGAFAINEPLPAGFALLEAGDSKFARVERAIDRLTLSSADLKPGIYQYSYLLRAVLAGRYSAPATTVRLAGGELIGTSNIATLAVPGH